MLDDLRPSKLYKTTNMLGDIILGYLQTVFNGLFWRRILAPIFKFIGGTVRYAISFNKSAYDKDNNTLLGFVFVFFTTVTIILIIKNV